jgi:hypothetical protein
MRMPVGQTKKAGEAKTTEQRNGRKLMVAVAGEQRKMFESIRGVCQR